VEKYDEVSRTLELARDLEKQFIGFANDVKLIQPETRSFHDSKFTFYLKQKGREAAEETDKEGAVGA
jgi:hypothetical protein